MITISPAAAEQIRKSAKENGSDNESDSDTLYLRIAARVTPDEALDYGLGFDKAKEDDIKSTSEGIDIVVAPNHAELVHGMHIDYVQLETEESNFIFQNPNDPAHKPTKE